MIELLRMFDLSSTLAVVFIHDSAILVIQLRISYAGITSLQSTFGMSLIRLYSTFTVFAMLFRCALPDVDFVHLAIVFLSGTPPMVDFYTRRWRKKAHALVSPLKITIARGDHGERNGLSGSIPEAYRLFPPREKGGALRPTYSITQRRNRMCNSPSQHNWITSRAIFKSLWPSLTTNARAPLYLPFERQSFNFSFLFLPKPTVKLRLGRDTVFWLCILLAVLLHCIQHNHTPHTSFASPFTIFYILHFVRFRKWQKQMPWRASAETTIPTARTHPRSVKRSSVQFRSLRHVPEHL